MTDQDVRRANPEVSGSKSGSPRARCSDTTRHALLAAALELFALHAFENVSIRAVGANTNVDASLVHRYFGSKEALFIEVIRFCQADFLRLGNGRQAFADATNAEILDGLTNGRSLRFLLLLLRSAGSNRARLLINQTLDRSIMARLETWMGCSEGDNRASLLMALLVGLVFLREVGVGLDVPDKRNALMNEQAASLVLLIMHSPNDWPAASDDLRVSPMLKPAQL